MHRDEAIYARSDARGVTLTAEEAALAAEWYHAAVGEGQYRSMPEDGVLLRRLEVTIEPPSTTPSP